MLSIYIEHQLIYIGAIDHGTIQLQTIFQL